MPENGSYRCRRTEAFPVEVASDLGGAVRDTTKVLLTFIGSIIFCSAVVATVQSFVDSGAGGGPTGGGFVSGIGLAMILIPRLPDRESRRTADEEIPEERATENLARR